MIKAISINNYKSILNLKFDLGQVNILIGENGGGKSNILEAISYGIAASLNKLDNEYLGLRGIRVTEPRFMQSAFGEQKEKISVGFYTDEDEYNSFLYKISPTNSKIESILRSKPDISVENSKMNISFTMSREFEDDSFGEKFADDIKKALIKSGIKDSSIKIKIDTKQEESSNYKDSDIFQFIKSFVFYCPEESSLRTYRDDIQLLPLGRKGEGLFRYLKEISNTEEGKKVIYEINKNLCLLDWFDSVDIPHDIISKDYSMRIKDKYVVDSLDYFDQRSTNEGFLYLLFYLTLFISKDTPRFFAIDNIEASFNPKLCSKIINVLIQLAKVNGKQVIFTTHSPFILDGMDLSDETQKLFVIKRNDEGHTKIKPVFYKAERKKKLSEIWMSGAIGGLPDNF